MILKFVVLKIQVFVKKKFKICNIYLLADHNEKLFHGIIEQNLF